MVSTSECYELFRLYRGDVLHAASPTVYLPHLALRVLQTLYRWKDSVRTVELRDSLASPLNKVPVCCSMPKVPEQEAGAGCSNVQAESGLELLSPFLASFRNIVIINGTNNLLDIMTLGSPDSPAGTKVFCFQQGALCRVGLAAQSRSHRFHCSASLRLAVA